MLSAEKRLTVEARSSAAVLASLKLAVLLAPPWHQRLASRSPHGEGAGSPCGRVPGDDEGVVGLRDGHQEALARCALLGSSVCSQATRSGRF